MERGRILCGMARAVRDHAGELALIDALDCGNPVGPAHNDVEYAARHMEFFAGLVTEIKGDTSDQGPGR